MTCRPLMALSRGESGGLMNFKNINFENYTNLLLRGSGHLTIREEERVRVWSGISYSRGPSYLCVYLPSLRFGTPFSGL